MLPIINPYHLQDLTQTPSLPVLPYLSAMWDPGTELRLSGCELCHPTSSASLVVVVLLRQSVTLYSPDLPETHMYLRLASNLKQSSCLSPSTAKIIGVSHHCQLSLQLNFYMCLTCVTDTQIKI